MKKRICMAAGCLLSVCLLSACAEEALDPAIPETACTIMETADEAFTEQDILDIFNGYAYADPNNRRPVDCVAMEGSAYGIIGVVQYITDDYEGCCFDFIREDGFPLKMGIEASPVGKSLHYLREDTVTCLLTDENGEVHTFTLAYYSTEAETGFCVTSD